MAAYEKVVISYSNKLFVVAVSVIIGWLFYTLSPVLIPFFISAILAYIADPLADKLESWNLSRMVAVSIVFSLLVLSILLILLVLLPLLGSQFGSLLQNLPEYAELLHNAIQPWLISTILPTDLPDINTIKKVLTSYWKQVSQVVGGIVSYMTRSGSVILQWIANLIIIPVVTFYLLRDWDLLVTHFRVLLPKRYAKRIINLSLECDEMLSAFMRGQLIVMMALTIIYTIGLAMMGLELALLLGLMAGILSFVPYLGLIVGIGSAGIAAFLQFHGWMPVLTVALVFGFAQIIEGMVLTPRFVGGRIGLHPVSIIFAVLAGGQLCGFIGVLLALPAASVIMVLLRHAHQYYIDSSLYS